MEGQSRQGTKTLTLFSPLNLKKGREMPGTRPVREKIIRIISAILVPIILVTQALPIEAAQGITLPSKYNAGLPGNPHQFQEDPLNPEILTPKTFTVAPITIRFLQHAIEKLKDLIGTILGFIPPTRWSGWWNGFFEAFSIESVAFAQTRAVTWIESSEEQELADYQTLRKAIEKSLGEEYTLYDEALTALFPDEVGVVVNEIKGKYWFGLPSGAICYREYYTLTFDTNKGIKKITFGVSGVSSFENYVAHMGDAWQKALYERDPSLVLKLYAEVLKLDVYSDYRKMTVSNQVIVQEYKEGEFAWEKIQTLTRGSGEYKALLEAEAETYCKLYKATEQPVLIDVILYSDKFIMHPEVMLITEVGGIDKAIILNSYLGVEEIYSGHLGELIDYYFNYFSRFRDYPETFLGPMEDVLGRDAVEEAAALTSSSYYADLIYEYLNGAPVEEYHTYGGRAVKILWYDGMYGGTGIEQIREDIKTALIDDGLLVAWRGQELPIATSTMRMIYIWHGGYKDIYKVKFENDVPFGGGRTHRTPDTPVTLQFQNILSPVYNYWSGKVYDEAEIPVPKPGGVVEKGTQEVFSREWVAGFDRVDYIELLKSQGKTAQEMADICIEKESNALWKIWKATGGRILRDLAGMNVIYVKGEDGDYTPKYIDFDLITASGNDILALFNVGVAGTGPTAGLKQEIRNSLVFLDLYAQPDLVEGLLGFYSAMVSDGMSDAEISAEFDKLEPSYPAEVKEAETIIKGIPDGGGVGKPVKGIVLAGGYGTRLQEGLLAEFPSLYGSSKPLLPLSQRPMLEYIVEMMVETPEIDEIILSTSGRFIEETKLWFSGFSRAPPTVTYHPDGTIDTIEGNYGGKKITIINEGENKLGSVGAVDYVLTKKDITGDFVIIGGDNQFTSFRLFEFIDFAQGKNAATIGIYEVLVALASKYGIAVCDDTGKVLEFQEKPLVPKICPGKELPTASTATYYLQRKHRDLIRRYIEEGLNPDNIGNIFKYFIEQSESVYGYCIPPEWYELGDIESFKTANVVFAAKDKDRAGIEAILSAGKVTVGRRVGGTTIEEIPLTFDHRLELVEMLLERAPPTSVTLANILTYLKISRIEDLEQLTIEALLEYEDKIAPTDAGALLAEIDAKYTRLYKDQNLLAQMKKIYEELNYRIPGTEHDIPVDPTLGVDKKLWEELSNTAKYPEGISKPKLEYYIILKEMDDLFKEYNEKMAEPEHGSMHKIAISLTLIWGAIFGYLVYPRFIADLLAKGGLEHIAVASVDIYVLMLEAAFVTFAMGNLMSAAYAIKDAVAEHGGPLATSFPLKYLFKETPESIYLHKNEPPPLPDVSLYPTATAIGNVMLHDWETIVKPTVEEIADGVRYYNQVTDPSGTNPKANFIMMDPSIWWIKDRIGKPGADNKGFVLSDATREGYLTYYTQKGVTVFGRTNFADVFFKAGEQNDLYQLMLWIKDLMGRGKTYEQAIEQLQNEGILVTEAKVRAAEAALENFIDKHPGCTYLGKFTYDVNGKVYKYRKEKWFENVAKVLIEEDSQRGRDFKAGQGWYLAGAKPPKWLLGEVHFRFDKENTIPVVNGVRDGLLVNAREFVIDPSVALVQFMTTPYMTEKTFDAECVKDAADAYWKAVMPILFDQGGGVFAGHNAAVRWAAVQALAEGVPDKIVPEWYKLKGVSREYKMIEPYTYVGEDYALAMDVIRKKDPITGRPYHLLLTTYREFGEPLVSDYWAKTIQGKKFYGSSWPLLKKWAKNIYKSDLPWYQKWSLLYGLSMYPAVPFLMSLILVNSAMWALGVPHFHAILPDEMLYAGGAYAISPMLLTWFAGFAQKYKEEGLRMLINWNNWKAMPTWLKNQLGSFALFVSMFPVGSDEAVQVMLGLKKSKFEVTPRDRAKLKTLWDNFEYCISQYPVEIYWKDKPHTIIPVNKGIVKAAGYWGLLALGVVTGNINPSTLLEPQNAFAIATVSSFAYGPLFFTLKNYFANRLAERKKRKEGGELGGEALDMQNRQAAMREMVRTHADDREELLDGGDRLIQDADERKAVEAYINLLEGYYTGKLLDSATLQDITDKICNGELSVGSAHDQARVRGVTEVTRIMFKQFTDLSDYEIESFLKRGDVVAAINNGDLNIIMNYFFANIDTAHEFDKVFEAVYSSTRGLAPPQEEWDIFRNQYLATAPDGRRNFFENKIAQYRDENVDMIVQAIAQRYLERELTPVEVTDWSIKWNAGKLEWAKDIRPYLTDKGAENFIVDIFMRMMDRRPDEFEVGSYKNDIRMGLIQPDDIVWDYKDEIEANSYVKPDVAGLRMSHFWRLVRDIIAEPTDIKEANIKEEILDKGKEVGKFPGTLEQALYIENRAKDSWFILPVEATSMTPMERLLLLTKFAQVRMERLGDAGKLTVEELLTTYGKFNEILAIPSLKEELLEYLNKYLPDKFLTDAAIALKNGLLNLKGEFEIVWENLEAWKTTEPNKDAIKADIVSDIRNKQLIEKTLEGEGITTSDITKVTLRYAGSGVIKTVFRTIVETKKGNYMFAVPHCVLLTDDYLFKYERTLEFMEDFNALAPDITPELYYWSSYSPTLLPYDAFGEWISPREYLSGERDNVMREMYPNEVAKIARAESMSLMRMYKSFFMKNYRCYDCGYIYKPELGDPEYGIGRTTPFEELPEDWVCPDCGADKSHFKPLETGVGVILDDCANDGNYIDRRLGSRYIAQLFDFDWVTDELGLHYYVRTPAKIIQEYINERFNSEKFGYATVADDFLRGLLDAYGKEEGKKFLDMARAEAQASGMTDVVNLIDNFLTNHYPKYIAPFKNVVYLKDVGNMVVVGDIHGAFEQLVNALVKAGVIKKGGVEGQPNVFKVGEEYFTFLKTPAQYIFFLGDYINKGPKAKEVIDMIMELEKKCHTVALMGNTEAAVLQGDWRGINSKYHGVDAENFLRQLGYTEEQIPAVWDILKKWGEYPHQATLGQILNSSTWKGMKRLAVINPDATRYLEWLVNLPVAAYVEMSGLGEKFLLVHAGITPAAWAKIKSTDALGVLRNIDNIVLNDIDVFYSLVNAAPGEWKHEINILKEIKNVFGIKKIFVGHHSGMAVGGVGEKPVNEIAEVGDVIDGEKRIVATDVEMSPGAASGKYVRAACQEISGALGYGARITTYGDNFISPRVEDLVWVKFLDISPDRWLKYSDMRYLVQLLDEYNNYQTPGGQIFRRVFKPWYFEPFRDFYNFDRGYVDLSDERLVKICVDSKIKTFEPPFTIRWSDLGKDVLYIFYDKKVEVFYVFDYAIQCILRATFNIKGDLLIIDSISGDPGIANTSFGTFDKAAEALIEQLFQRYKGIVEQIIVDPKLLETSPELAAAIERLKGKGYEVDIPTGEITPPHAIPSSNINELIKALGYDKEILGVTAPEAYAMFRDAGWARALLGKEFIISGKKVTIPTELKTLEDIKKVYEVIEVALGDEAEVPDSRGVTDDKVRVAFNEVLSSWLPNQALWEILSVLGVKNMTDLQDVLNNYPKTTSKGYELTPRKLALFLYHFEELYPTFIQLLHINTDQMQKSIVPLCRLWITPEDQKELLSISAKYTTVNKLGGIFNPTIFGMFIGCNVEIYLYELAHAKHYAKLDEWARAKGIDLLPYSSTYTDMVAMSEGYAEAEEIRLLKILDDVFKMELLGYTIPGTYPAFGLFNAFSLANNVYSYDTSLDIIRHLLKLGFNGLPRHDYAQFLKEYEENEAKYNELYPDTSVSFIDAYFKYMNEEGGYRTVEDFFTAAAPTEDPQFLKLTFRPNGNVEITKRDLESEVMTRIEAVKWLQKMFVRIKKSVLDLESDPYIVYIYYADGSKVARDPRAGEFSVFVDELASPGGFIYDATGAKAYWGGIDAPIITTQFSKVGTDLMIDDIEISSAVTNIPEVGNAYVAAQAAFLHAWKVSLPTIDSPSLGRVSVKQVIADGPLSPFVKEYIEDGSLLLVSGPQPEEYYTYEVANPRLYEKGLADITFVDDGLLLAGKEDIEFTMLFTEEGELKYVGVHSLSNKYSGEIPIIVDGEVIPGMRVNAKSKIVDFILRGKKKISVSVEKLVSKAEARGWLFKYKLKNNPREIMMWFDDKEMSYMLKAELEVGKYLEIDLERAGIMLERALYDPYLQNPELAWKEWRMLPEFGDDLYAGQKVLEIRELIGDYQSGQPWYKIHSIEIEVTRPPVGSGKPSTYTTIFFGEGGQKGVSEAGVKLGQRTLQEVFPEGLKFRYGEVPEKVRDITIKPIPDRPGDFVIKHVTELGLESEYEIKLSEFIGKGDIDFFCSRQKVIIKPYQGKLIFEAYDIPVDMVTKRVGSIPIGGWKKVANVRIQCQMAEGGRVVLVPEEYYVSSALAVLDPKEAPITYQIKPWGLMKLVDNSVMRFLGTGLGTAVFVGGINAALIYVNYASGAPLSVIEGDIVRGAVSTTGWVSMGNYGLKQFANFLKIRGVTLGIKGALAYGTVVGIAIEFLAEYAQCYYLEWKQGVEIDAKLFGFNPSLTDNLYRAWLDLFDRIGELGEWLSANKFPYGAGEAKAWKDIITFAIHNEWLSSPEGQTANEDKIKDNLFLAMERAEPYEDDFKEVVVKPYLEMIAWPTSTWTTEMTWGLYRAKYWDEPGPYRIPPEEVYERLKTNLIELHRRWSEGTGKHAPISSYLGFTPEVSLLALTVMRELMDMKVDFWMHWKDGKFGVTYPTWEWQFQSPLFERYCYVDCRQAVGMSPGILDKIYDLLDAWKTEEEPGIPGENLVWDPSFEKFYPEPGTKVYADIEDTPGFLERYEVSPAYSFFTVPEGLLSDGAKYFWNVKGYNVAGSISSDTWDFTVWTLKPPEIPVPTIKPPSQGPVKVEGRQLLVNGQPYIIKGVGYNPVPIGEQRWNMADTRLYERDFPKLRTMGCNTIRTWDKVNKTLLDYAQQNNLKVCAGFWVDTSIDFANLTVRNSIKEDFKNYVAKYNDHPAILLWAIGNENNLHNGNNPEWYSLVNEMAKDAYSIEHNKVEREGGEEYIPTYHPVAIVNGDIGYNANITDDNIGNSAKKADDASFNYVDIWAENFYPGRSFGITFNDYTSLTQKPLWISEYGVDAWYVNPSGYPDNPADGYEDETTQAQWVGDGWANIAANWSGADPAKVCIGGTIMAYSDEWWKGGTPSTHDWGGSPGWGTRQPDGFSNEEWYGIMKVSKNPVVGEVDIATQRQIYTTLQTLW